MTAVTEVGSRAELERAQSGDPRRRWRETPRGNVIVLVVVTLLVLGGAWALNRPAGGDSTPVEVMAGDAPAPEVGAPATDFTAVTTTGERVRLSDYAGQPVWISFVATWCSSCRAEAPDIQDAWEESDGEVAMLSVYLAEDASQVAVYADRLGITYPQIPDPQNAIAGQYRVMAVPSHVFIQADGLVASTHVGVLTRDQMTQALAEVAGR